MQKESGRTSRSDTFDRAWCGAQASHAIGLGTAIVSIPLERSKFRLTATSKNFRKEQLDNHPTAVQDETIFNDKDAAAA